MFRVAPPLELKKLETIFRHKVFRMLLNKGKITEEMMKMLSGWNHTGFNVFCGNRISPNVETAMENLARYIIRAPFSQERMQYLDKEGTITSKHNVAKKEACRKGLSKKRLKMPTRLASRTEREQMTPAGSPPIHLLCIRPWFSDGNIP